MYPLRYHFRENRPITSFSVRHEKLISFFFLSQQGWFKLYSTNNAVQSLLRLHFPGISYEMLKPNKAKVIMLINNSWYCYEMNELILHHPKAIMINQNIQTILIKREEAAGGRRCDRRFWRGVSGVNNNRANWKRSGGQLFKIKQTGLTHQ